MTAAPFPEIPAWPPVRYTAPLAEEFPSAFDGFADLFQLVWRNFAGYELDAWQVALIRAILEVYPPGHDRAGQLRYLTVVVSLARQNGKTEIAAALGLWALLVKKAAIVVGLATSAEQARLIYDRTMRAIKGTAKLRAMFRALTETRGIRTLTGGKYEIKAAKSDALQGIPLDLGLVDELHILAQALWTDLVNGLGGRPNCMVIGVTTAGDDDSALLLHLYELGDRAVSAGATSRMGFFVWESPEARIPDDDEELARFLAAANPAIACGRVDLENTISAVRDTPPPDAIRYRLNRFTAATDVFLGLATWTQGFTRDPFPTGVQPIFTIDWTPEHRYGVIGAFAKLPDGTIYCDLVASVINPTIEQFADLAVRLSQHSPATFAMDGFGALRKLGQELERRGLPVTVLSQGEILAASALFYAKAIQGKLRHPGHALMAMQVPRTARKNVGEGFRVSRKDSSVEIDAVMAHVIGVYLAETVREVETQIF